MKENKFCMFLYKIVFNCNEIKNLNRWPYTIYNCNYVLFFYDLGWENHRY